MDHHDGRLVGPLVEGGGEPVELLLAEHAGRVVGLFQRVEQEEVGPGVFEDHHLPVRSGSTWASELGMVFQRLIAVVVIPHLQVQREAAFAKRLKQWQKRLVVGVQSQSDTQKSPLMNAAAGLGSNFATSATTFFEMIGRATPRRSMSRAVGGNVNIRQQHQAMQIGHQFRRPRRDFAQGRNPAPCGKRSFPRNDGAKPDEA